MEKCAICLKTALQLFETSTPGVLACFKCQPMFPEVSMGLDGSQDSNQSSVEMENIQEVVVVTEDQESEDVELKDLVCSICHKTFERNAQLQNHLRNHLAERRFQCTYCDKAFSQSNNLRAHLRIHTNERPYKCTLCDKAFTQVTNLNNHFRLHTGERPFVCTEPGCNKAFAQVTNLNQHRKRHVTGKPVDTYYPCNLCGEQFEQRNHMFDHRRAVHGVSRATGSKRSPSEPLVLTPSYVCGLCEQEFLNQSQLSSHVAVCEHEFNSQSQLSTQGARNGGIESDPLGGADEDSDEGKVPPLKCVFSGCDVRVWTHLEQSKHLLQAHQLRVRSNNPSIRRGRPPKRAQYDSGKQEQQFSVQVQNKFMPNAKYVAIFSE